MKKILLFLAGFVFFFGISSVYAANSVNSFVPLLYSPLSNKVNFDYSVSSTTSDYVGEYNIYKKFNGGSWVSLGIATPADGTTPYSETTQYTMPANGTYQFKIVVTFYDSMDVPHNITKTSATIIIVNADITPPDCGSWTPDPAGTIPVGPQRFDLTGSSDTGGSGINPTDVNRFCNDSTNGLSCTITISDIAGNTTVCTSPVAHIASVTYNYTSTSELTECPMSGTKEGVPVIGSRTAFAPTAGTLVCNHHTYYTGDEYTKTYTDTSGITQCDNTDDHVVNWNESAHTITCQKYDDTPPSYAILDCPPFITDKWKNYNGTTTCAVTHDGGPSPVTIEYSIDSSAWAKTGNNGTDNFYAIASTNLKEGITNVRMRVSDAAGSVISNTFTIKKDTITPSDSNLTSLPGDNSNLSATNSQNFQITKTDGGSPITGVFGKFESYNSLNTYGAERDYISGTPENIQDVNNNPINGGRDYKLNITRICDEAGNCNTSPSKIFKYYVFANSIQPQIISNPIGFADGTGTTLTITLKDAYDNPIVRATRNGMNRQVNINIAYDNQLYLDQITQDSSAVWIQDTKSNITRLANNSNSINSTDQDSLDGDYRFSLQAYSPTTDTATYHIPPGNTLSLNITATVAGLLGSGPTPLGVVAPAFKPIYYTDITDDISTSGFIAGAQQRSLLDIIKLNTARSAGSPGKILGTFTSTSFDLFAGTNQSQARISGGNPIVTQSVLMSSFNINGEPNKDLYTFLKPKPGIAATNTSDAKFDTIVNYAIDGKNIAYYSDSVGASDSAIQVGLKVLGNSSSDIRSQTVDQQFPADVRFLGNSDKFILKSKILQKAADITKGSDSKMIGITDTIDSINGSLPTGASALGVVLGTLNKTTLYIKPNNAGDTITIDAGSGSTIPVSGNRTLLVVGGNIYIKSDIYYMNPKTDLLTIMALKDDTGKGGNIYIDPEITNISATLFASRSVMSYSDTLGAGVSGEIGGNNATADLLKNQLYVFGSIVSLNTIGGASNGKCPYYVEQQNPGLCSISGEAQKYDFNYLRRFHLVSPSGLPYKAGKVVGEGTCTWPNVCNFSGTTQMKKIKPADLYGKYPVIIEYNPSVQNNPGMIFTLGN